MTQLDGLRFIAVAAVMFGHWTQDYFPEADRFLAGSGVNLFFVLSGFLISDILIRNADGGRKTLINFYIRRFLRIFPLYYAVLIGAYIINVDPIRQEWPWFFSYTSNFITALNHGSSGSLTHLWSLAVEEQYYIFFPFLVLAINPHHYRKLFWVLLILSVASRGIAFALIDNKTTAWWIAYVLTPSCFDCFAIGALLAYTKLNYKKQIGGLMKRKYLFFGALIASVLLYVHEVVGPNNLWSILFVRLFFAVFCFWLIGKAATINFRGWFGAFLNNKAVIYLGKISYGLYVFHNFMPWLFSKFDVPYERIYYPLVTISLAALSWHFYEKPINNLKKYFEYKERVPEPKPDNLLHSGALHHK